MHYKYIELKCKQRMKNKEETSCYKYSNTSLSYLVIFKLIVLFTNLCRKYILSKSSS